MDSQLTIEELESTLDRCVVYDTLNGLSMKAKTWNGGGALIHRVVAAGFAAETGARNIAEGNTAIKRDSTFRDMRDLDRQMYESTVSWLYPIIKSGIYFP
ncbi:MAG: hypothetical protein Q8O89_06970 [Nanoarchaeota archaeon]|nr:hypothetical protein [Nanoarchaeota archaeon]